MRQSAAREALHLGLWTVVFRTVLMYFAVFIVLRVMGKREIGKLSVFDLVISIMIADIAVMTIDDSERPLLVEFAPIIVLLAIQITLAFVTLKSPKMREVFDGTPSIIIANGVLQQDVMKKQRYNLDDLMLQLRGQGIDNVNDVTYAILESTGELSVFKASEEKPNQNSSSSNASKQEGQKESKSKPSNTQPALPEAHQYQFTSLPLPLIMEGKVQEQNLLSIDKTRFWLKNQIQQKGVYDFKQVFFCSIDHKGHIYVDSNPSKLKR
ncbi:YetF domain-containing protein [Paenibacillus popilliae]|uniref:YetF domain-containing protein n=1 Tax=Paenibacillus popilliae TaxID=78057 RepID=UPI003F55FE76